ncbi:hypothetical protein ABMA27_005309 [Loxostege sticticalis]|uniref:CCHC-type domain-containing protein n=1 Tax=Loxostege sticticalis TaxID=481309 RepID=A0ABR3HIP2_LOXSC
MEKSDKGPEEPISEVGSEGQNRPPSEGSSTGFLNSMEALFTRLLAATTQSASSVNHTNMVQLLPFNPDDADADVEGWCRVTEIIVNSKKLSGVDLLVALTSALKGRAAATLTKVRLDELTWDTVKQVLMAKFCQPKLIQDYFDDILRFQIGAKESASESAMRLWSLIERIPKVEMTEEVITGFVISVLCLRDNLIRRELNSSAIVTRAQLFRTLGSISLKRRAEPIDSHVETDQKRPRLSESKFHGICHRCGVSGHKQIDCRRPRQDTSSLRQASSSSLDQANIKPSSMSCYTCGKPGHVSTACPEKRSGGSAVKEVNTCEHRTSRGTLTASSDGSCRTLKYSHENLRSVPNGHEGLTELAASIMAAEEAVTAPDEQSGSDHDDNSETLSARSFDTLTADSTTLTAHSGPASVRSETISVDSEDEGPVTFEVEAEVHHSG